MQLQITDQYCNCIIFFLFIFLRLAWWWLQNSTWNMWLIY